MSGFVLPPKERVNQVIATLAIEGMYVSEEFKQELLKVARGEKTSEELIQEITKKYAH